MTKQEFNRARGMFLDRLRRDAALTPTARLVGWEIAMNLNFDQGCIAWPSHATLELNLALGAGTIKRAVADLERVGYFEIERRRVHEGRKNYYRAPWILQPNLGLTGGPEGTNPGTMVGTKEQPKNIGPRDQSDPDVRPKSDPISPSKPSSKELPEHHHHHQHHQGTAADVTNALIRIAGITLQRGGRNSFAAEQLGFVKSWLGMGLDVDTIIRSAEDQMDRHRAGSTATTPIRSVRFFEPELMKIYEPLLKAAGAA